MTLYRETENRGVDFSSVSQENFASFLCDKMRLKKGTRREVRKLHERRRALAAPRPVARIVAPATDPT
jgi:hypothetical protein